MRHALADLEGGGGYGGCSPFENSEVKKSDKAKQKTEEMKRKIRENVERLFNLCVCTLL